MRKVYLAVAIFALTFLAANKATKPTELVASDVGQRVVILGQLGRPVGETVTIHGKKVHAGKGNQIDFFVDAVNGKKLQNGTTVQIDGIEQWPLDTEAEIRGMEQGTLTFTDIRATGFGHNDPRFVIRQTLYLEFTANEVIAPNKLRIGAPQR